MGALLLFYPHYLLYTILRCYYIQCFTHYVWCYVALPNAISISSLLFLYNDYTNTMVLIIIDV